MAPWVLLAVFCAAFLAIIAVIRIDSGTLLDGGFSPQGRLAIFSGRVAEPLRGVKLICEGGCVRMYGSEAANGSYDHVLGVKGTYGDGYCITAVRESWT